MNRDGWTPEYGGLPIHRHITDATNLRNFVTNIEQLSRYEGLELYNPPDD